MTKHFFDDMIVASKKFLLCGLILGVFATQANADRKTLRMAAVNLSPVVTDQHDGYLDRLIVEMFGRIGAEVQFLDMPASRSLKSVNSGLIDGDAGRLEAAGATLPNIVKLADPMMFVEFGGLYIDPDITITSLEDFAKYRVGYLHGWVFAENLFASHDRLSPVRTTDSLMQMLKAGRIDVAFITRAPGLELAQSYDIETPLFSDFNIRRSLHLSLNASFAADLPALSQALAAMHADGTYGRIMTGYPEKEQ